MDSDDKYSINDIYEMIFLLKRREELMSMSEHIVIEYLYHDRLLKLTIDERKKLLQMRERFTKILRDVDFTA